jgi:hypothetical protein
MTDPVLLSDADMRQRLVQFIHQHSVGVTKPETEIALKLFFRKKVRVDTENVAVFKKITELPLCVELNCQNNQLTHLPALPNCVKLNCQTNQLIELPALPKCQVIKCYDNQLITLPALPRCTTLWCRNNQLTELSALPVCQKLECYNNQLIELPELPECSLLLCSNNQLTKLPALPICSRLNCENNQLTELPALPECQDLDCSHNQLTKLPSLPQCQWLYCSYNQIRVLPRLPHCPNPVIHHNPISLMSTPNYQTNRAWWDSSQQRQIKQQLRKQLTQQQKKQIQRTDPISLQQFQHPALGDDLSIYDDSTLSKVPFRGTRGIEVRRNLPLKQAVQIYKTQQDPAIKSRTKKDIAKYIALLQMLQTYGLEDLFGKQQ